MRIFIRFRYNRSGRHETINNFLSEVCKLTLKPRLLGNACFSMTGRQQRRANSVELSELPKASRPLRAKSVCLSERPQSKYGRPLDSSRIRFSDKKFFPRQQSADSKPRRPSTVTVKSQNRKVVEKVPLAINIQNLSIPMKYADNPKPKHSTSKSTRRIDSKTKLNLPKQVSDNKRLCESVCGKETENKLLVQISEAEQVSDFERILNSNAIQSERQGHVWRGCATQTSSAAVAPRPRSAYSLYTVTQAYHYLFQQHEDSLQPLIDEYRQTAAEDIPCPQHSLLDKNWCENLQDLTEFYGDDQDLKHEVETITDRIITEEVSSEGKDPKKRQKYFNVNLADLFGLRVNGEGFSPSHDPGPSPDVDKADEEEWRTSMNANSDERQNPQENVDCLAQNLNSVKIDSDATVPAITFSNCCDGCARNENPDNTNVVIHLAVPTIDSDETRPPMM